MLIDQGVLLLMAMQVGGYGAAAENTHRDRNYCKPSLLRKLRLRHGRSRGETRERKTNPANAAPNVFHQDRLFYKRNTHYAVGFFVTAS